MECWKANVSYWKRKATCSRRAFGQRAMQTPCTVLAHKLWKIKLKSGDITLCIVYLWISFLQCPIAHRLSRAPPVLSATHLHFRAASLLLAWKYKTTKSRIQYSTYSSQHHRVRWTAENVAHRKSKLLFKLAVHFPFAPPTIGGRYIDACRKHPQECKHLLKYHLLEYHLCNICTYIHTYIHIVYYRRNIIWYW